MTPAEFRAEIQQYQGLKARKERLDAECQYLRHKYQVHDSVTGSMVNHPCTKRSYRLEGIAPHARNAVRKTLQEYEDTCSRIKGIECFIDGLEDATIKEACLMFYTKGYTWQEVGQALRMGEDAIRMKVSRYINKL